MHPTHSMKVLFALALCTAIGCDDSKKDDKKADDKKAADKKADDKKADAKGDVKADAKADAKAEPTPEPAPEPAAKQELTATELADWGVKVGLPAGAKAGAVEAGDAELEMPDSIDLATEGACGYDIDLTRHWKKSFDSMYDNSKKMVDGLTEVKWLKDEKTATSYTIHYVGKAPLGDMYGAATGLVVGDRLILCDAGLGRLEEKQAACVLEICSSIAPK
jgi:hypothetical protein